MPKVDILRPVFVQYIPPADQIKEGELYISLEFETAIHKCCCGCGEEVVTPFNAAQWKLKGTRKKVSLHPSIGNWSYPCKSHYFIKDNRILWAGALSDAVIERVQANDKKALDGYIAAKNSSSQSSASIFERIFAVLRRYTNEVVNIIFPKK